MTHRDRNPEPLILPAVLENKGTDWGESTRQLALTDAQRVLEAMIAVFGVEGAVRALDHQGFKGDAYRYLLKPVYEEAVSRRARAGHSAGDSVGDA
jgi:hypothetical protein